jgi:hypothetical protein
MAEKSSTGGMMLVYGVAIGAALARGNASTGELLALRSQTKAALDAQGDLVSALDALDEEIGRRGGEPRSKAAAEAATATPSERFIVQMVDVPLSPESSQNIERAIAAALRNTLAKVDTRGDLAVTPLSELKSFGAGLGGATAGVVMTFD